MITDNLQLRYKLLLPSIVVTILFFTGVHFYWLPKFLESKKQEFFKQQYYNLHIIDNALKDIKSPDDIAAHYDLLDLLMVEHPVWKALVVYDKFKQRIFSSKYNRKNLSDKNNNKTELINIEYNIVRNGVLIGKLAVIADAHNILQQDMRGIFRLEMMFFGLFGLSALLLVSLQDRLVRTPLQKLAVAVKKLSQGDMTVELPEGSKDEMGELVFAVRTLSNSLQLTYLAFHDEVAEVIAIASELTDSEQRFRTVFKSIADSLVLIDQQGIIKSVNPAATRMFGYLESELLGQPIEKIMPEAHKHKHATYLSAFLSGKGVGFVGGTSRENTAVHKDGTEIPIDLSINVLRIGDQDHFIGVIRDISAHKQFQKKLTAEKELAQNYLNTASVIMMAIDQDGQITMVNNKGCEVLGYAENQLLGKNWFNTFFEKAVAEALGAEFAQVMAGETYFLDYLECHVKTSSKEEKIVVWYTNVIRDVNTGIATGLLVSGEDITESRKNENIRISLQKQLQQSQKMEAVGQLTGGIAHDFNNILASMMGYCELALLKLEKISDEKLKNYIGNIYTSGERARDLVGKMLAFSRGKDNDTPTPLFLNAVISELIPMLRSVIPTSVQIDTQLDENLGTVLADTIDIQQIVMNLCINARDAMEGVGRIVIQTRNVSQSGLVCASCHNPINGDYVELVVKNSGPQIPGHILSRLFEPFFTTKEVGKGTGLGLSVIHGVVHARDGHILVESNETAGSQFHILFKPVVKRSEIDRGRKTMEQLEGT